MRCTVHKQQTGDGNIMVRLGDVMLDPPHSTQTHTKDKRQHTHKRQKTTHTGRHTQFTVEENKKTEKTKTPAFFL